MGLYKEDGSPYWYCRFTIQGKKHRLSTGIEATERNRRAAEKRQEELRAEAKEALLNPHLQTTGMTLKAAFDLFWEEKVQHEADARNTGFKIKAVLNYFGDDRLVEDLERGDIMGLRSHLQTGGKKGHRGNATVNIHIDILARMTRYGEANWNGFRMKHTINWSSTHLQRPGKRTRILRKTEQGPLWDALDDDMRDVCTFLLLTAQRVNSVLRLTWAGVDFDAGTIEFKDVKSKRRNVSHTIPMSDAARVLLRDIKMQNHGTVTVFSYTVKNWTPSARKKIGARLPWTYDGMSSRFDHATERAGCGDLTIHDLRRTSATRMLLNGVSIYDISKLLNHANVTTTEGYLAHANTAAMKGALDTLAESGQTSGQTTEVGAFLPKKIKGLKLLPM